MTDNPSGADEARGYRGEWWDVDLTEEEERLFPTKYFDRLPGASLPKGVAVEEDVAVEMRDGLRLAANVFRPDRDGAVPVIVTFTPFSKDYYGQHAAFGVSERTAFEAPDPGFWVPHGYAVVLVDRRGTGRSPPGGTGGADDYYDGIEWAAARDWSTGKVGMLGHSALAMCQWEVAALEEPPPHLEAIVPWGAFTHDERDAFRPGGVPETAFDADVGENLPRWQADFEPEPREPKPSVFSAHRWGGTEAEVPLENITVPMLVGSTWADTEFHLRGNLRAWRRASTPREHKWLYTYAGRKWKGLYTPPEARTMQRVFLDHFLKGEDTGVLDVPRVRLAVRESLFDVTVRYERDWPIPRTDYTRLYLDAADGTLTDEAPTAGSVARYDATANDGSAAFDVTFESATELSGHSSLAVWLSPEDADDLDLFVTLRKLDGHGHEVRFASEAAPGRYPVDQGWLRLSKRALDGERSTPWLPVQRSVSAGEPADPVEPGEVVPARVQLVGSSTAFAAGETLRLELSGTHGVEDDLLKGYGDSVNEGTHAVYTGGDHPSSLQVPVVPEPAETDAFELTPRRAVTGD